MDARKKELIDATKAAMAVHVEWTQDPNRPHPDATYWDAIEALIRVFSVGDIPHDLRNLALAVDELSEQLAIFDELDRVTVQDAFWTARQRVAEQLLIADGGGPRKKPRETVAQLVRDKVEHWQICKMVGLMLPNGEPDYDRLNQEIENPGSVIGPDFIHPEDQREAVEAKAAAARLMESKPQPTRQPCPETPEQLFNQGVSVAQAATMLCRPAEEVAALFDELATAKRERERKAALEALAAGKEPPAATSGDEEPKGPPPGDVLPKPQAEWTPGTDAPGADPADLEDAGEAGTSAAAAAAQELYGDLKRGELAEECRAQGIGYGKGDTREQLLAKLIAKAEADAAGRYEASV